MISTTGQKLVAEGLGTGLLLASIVGSGIMAETLSGGNVGLELLCNALSIAAMLVVLITTLGPISGAHFNPAVTMVFTLRGDIGVALAIAYVAVQVAGGILGVLATHLMYDQAIVQFAAKARTGTGQWFSEIVATAGLVMTILLTIQTNSAQVPAMVGLYVGSAIYFASSTAFANPAVSIGRLFSDSFAGIDPSHVAPFIAAQLVGALLGLALCHYLAIRRPNPPIDPETTSAE